MIQIQKTTLEGSVAVELTTPVLRLVAVTDFGPRLAHLSLAGGENLLFWKPGKMRRGAWDLRGGHRVWAAHPGADESEDSYAPDNAPCELEIFGDGFRVTGATCPLNATRRGFAVRAVSADRLEVENFLTNAGNMLYCAGVWALTCTLPGVGARYAIPLGDGSAWDNFSLVHFRTWGGQGKGGFHDPQIAVGDETLVVTPRGVENKRMIQAPRGIFAMSDAARALTFAKKVDWRPGEAYPLNTNLAFYIGPDNFMVEMESMGPSRTLKPGETLRHPETWVLRKGAVAVEKAAPLMKLFA
ncbi:MAG: hypothetical protein HUU04_10210 [Verrucomicrobiae bacterium]|nr:hypothetical protein [Verrucomicrobiae bacterium]